jgi:hypothetical protein
VTRQEGEIRMELWAASDNDDSTMIGLYGKKPKRSIEHGCFYGNFICCVDRRLLPELQWKDGPVQVEIKVKEL